MQTFPFEFQSSDPRTCSLAPLQVRCYESEAHDELIKVALILVAIWPVGVPLMYTALLYPCRKPLLKRRPTRLVRAVR